MRRTAGEIHLTRTVFDEKQHVQGFQGKCFDGEEIAREKLIFVMVEKRAPGTAVPTPFRGRRNTVTQQYGADRRCADIKS